MSTPIQYSASCPILVGRASVMESLDNSMARVRAGNGQIVLLAGEAGIGKSRLVAETTRRFETQEGLLLQAHCFEQDCALPFAPLLDLLRESVESRSSEELASRLGPTASELGKLLPEFGGLLSLTPTPPLQIQKRSLFQSLVLFFKRLAERQSLMIVIEDLHWSDDASCEFLSYFARQAASFPILLLLTYRHDEAPPGLTLLLASLERERLASEVILKPLTLSETDEMVRAIFGLERPVRAEFLEPLYALTEGNPFFVEEIIRALVAEGGIAYTGGGWIRKPIRELDLPRSVRAAVQRRVTRLSEPARQLLALLSVAGREFDFALLEQITRRAEPELVELLKELIAAQLLVEQSAERFAFRHALTRQAIYTDLLARERKVLHRVVAETMESIDQGSRGPSPFGGVYPDAGRAQGGSGQATHLGDLAYHYYEAGVWEKALLYSQRAGEKAQTLYAPRAAAEHFTRALEATRQLGQAIPAELLRARARSYETLGEFDRACADFETALQSVRASTPRDPPMELQLLLDLGLLWQGRDFSQTGKYDEDALELARTMDDPNVLAHSLNRMGNWYVNVEKPLEALQYHRKARDIFQDSNDRRGLAKTFDLMGLASNFSGDLIQGATYYGQAIRLLRELDDREGLTSSLAMATMCGGNYGTTTMVPAARLAESDREGEEALKIAREIGWRAGEAVALMMWGRYLGPHGEYARAFPLLKEALELAKEIEHRQWIAATDWTLGQLYLDVLALPAAHQHLERGLVLARELNSMHLLCCNSGSFASACILENDLTRAESVLAQVLRHDTPMQTQGQRMCWYANAELACARGEEQLALQIADRLIASAPNVRANEKRIVPLLWQLRGEVLTQMKHCDEAEHVLRTAQEAAFLQGARPILWRIHIALGRVYQMQGRRDEAKDALTAARTIIEELAANVPDPSVRDNFVRRACPPIPHALPLSPRLAAKKKFGGLTEREREVAALIAQGKSNREIADALVLSQRTAEVHVGNIMSKLGFTSRAQIAVWAAEKGLADWK